MTQFDQLRVHQVRSIFMSYSTYGKLGPQQFASCMNELHVHSPYTVRRLFTLFDRDVSGDVMMREFATGFFLLCGGTIHEKLAEAFNLFDLDGNGFLHPVELDMLLDSFYASVYPPTLPLRPFPPISMAFQACSLALRHVPVCLVVQSRWTWCARPSLSPPTSSSPMRASITR
jgi:hypothetical protein